MYIENVFDEIRDKLDTLENQLDGCKRLIVESIDDPNDCYDELSKIGFSHDEIQEVMLAYRSDV